MKLLLFTLLLLAAAFHPLRAATYQPVEGDIVFQSMPHGDLTDAIEGITESPLSHCGIVHQAADGWVVIEAVGPVKETGLTEWIARGREQAVTVFRLKEAYRDKIPDFVASAQTYEGLPYDFHYEFDDRAIYCSELVFKAFRHAAHEDLGKVQALGDLHVQGHEAFIRSLEGGTIPVDRKMITPRAISEASQLEKVFPP